MIPLSEKGNILRLIIKEVDRDILFENNMHLLPLIGQERRERIDRISNNRLKNMQLYSELTMIEEASKDLNVPVEKINVLKTPEGKPYIKGFEDYHISISHCDGMILFASHSSALGVDIEKPKSDYERIARRFFTEDEFKKIMNSPSPADEFLLVWTRKEAFVKLTGEGLARALDSFNVYDEGAYIYKTESVVSGSSSQKYCYSYCFLKEN